MAVFGARTENYFDEAYWNNRYTRDSGSFDWYQHYKGIAPLIKMYMKATDAILMVGCGSARNTVMCNSIRAVLSEEMVEDGYQKIMNIDISDVLINVMTTKYKHMPQLQYRKMDVRCMKEFEDKSFHCVLDKGMLDNLMCGASAQACVAAMLSEVYRLLKPGGCYLVVSYGDPRSRMAYLKTRQLPWESTTFHAIPRINSRRSHEVYPLRKITEPVILQKDLMLGLLLNLDDPDLHFVYVCVKEGGPKAKPKGVEVPTPMLRCKW